MPETTAQRAARAIRIALASSDRSQRWLADQLGESQHWLSRRMAGTTALTTDDLDRIAGVFGLDLFGLLALAAQRMEHAA